MVVIGKAVGEEGLRSLLQIIATRASINEAVLKDKLGEGFTIDQETGVVSVDGDASITYATDEEIESVISGFDDIFN